MLRRYIRYTALTKRFEKKLSVAFPRTSLALLTYLKQQNRKFKNLPRWRVTQFEDFVIALNETATQYNRARREGYLATTAWLARNFLELSIWTEFCCASEANAKRFNQDFVRDLYGMVAAARRGAPQEFHQGMDGCLKELINVAHPTKITDDFKRVAEAAKELGREEEFTSHNKFFSKMAHPTALLVITRRKNPFLGRREQAGVFILGAEFALRSLATLLGFVLNNFRDPQFEALLLSNERPRKPKERP